MIHQNSKMCLRPFVNCEVTCLACVWLHLSAPSNSQRFENAQWRESNTCVKIAVIFVICYLLFVICYLSFVICYLLFVICYLLYLLYFHIWKKDLSLCAAASQFPGKTNVMAQHIVHNPNATRMMKTVMRKWTKTMMINQFWVKVILRRMYISVENL